MLPLWHRILTKPIRQHARYTNQSERTAVLQKAVREAPIRMNLTEFIDRSYQIAREEVNHVNVASLKESKPLADLCWLEWDSPAEIASKYNSQGGCLVARTREGHFSLTAFAVYEGEVLELGHSLIKFDEQGVCAGTALYPVSSDFGIQVSSYTINALSAFAFAHCSNVEKVEDGLRNPDKKWCRRQKLPEIVFTVLKIPDTAKRYASSGTSGESGTVRHHVCRGHFAVYKPEKPLFGKFVGKVWISQHYKGSKKNGEVIKDYEI